MVKYEIQVPGQRGWKTEFALENGVDDEATHARVMSFYALYEAPKRIMKSEVVHQEDAKAKRK